MSEATDLISGDALKAAAQRFLGEVGAKIDQEQGGLLSIFDSWFSRVLTKLSSLDRERPWEESVNAHAAKIPGPAQDLQWDLNRLRLFLDRWDLQRRLLKSRYLVSRRSSANRAASVARGGGCSSQCLRCARFAAPLSHPRRLSGRRGQRRQTRRNSRIRRCASRRLSRRYALHRQFRTKRNLRG